MILFIFTALFSGMLLSLQQAMGGLLGERIGNMNSSVANHLGGALLGGVLLLAGFSTGWLHVDPVPWVYFLGGCLGFLLVALLNYAIPKIGVAAASLLLLSGQLVTSLLIDHFGALGGDIRPLTLSKILGIALLLTGAVLVFGRQKAEKIRSLCFDNP